MDDVSEALLGLRDSDSVNDAPGENLHDDIQHVSPLLDAVSKDMPTDVNMDITGKKRRRKVKKKVNVVNEIQSMHQMEMNGGSSGEITAQTNGILGASDSVTEGIPNLEKAELPRLDAVSKENGSEVNKSMTKNKKTKKKVNACDDIPSTHQIEMNMGSTEDLVEVKAPANGNSEASDGIRDYHVITGEPVDILPLKDVLQLEIAEQPRLDVVPKEYGSEGNIGTAKKKKRKKKVAVVSEIHEMEKNMSSTENLVEVKTQLSDNVGASSNAGEYNAVAKNELEKYLPNKDVPATLSEQLELAVVSNEKAPECKDLTKKKRQTKKEAAISEIQCIGEVVKNTGSTENLTEIKAQISDNLVVSENTSDMDTTQKKKRKRKVTVTHEAQCDQAGMDIGSTENLVEIKSQVKDNLEATAGVSECHVVHNESEKNIPSIDIPMQELEHPKLDVSKSNASDTDTTKKNKVTVITETRCMDQTGMNMTSAENHTEIRAQASDDLGASDNISDYHVVNLSDSHIPMQELSEQPKLEVSKQDASTRGTHVKKKRRGKKVKAVNENHVIQDMHQTEVNASITENRSEINGSDNMSTYHVVNNEPEKNLLEQVKHPDVSLVVDASEETMGTKKKKKPKKKVNVLNDVRNMDQALLNAVTTDNVTENIDQKNGTLETSNGVNDCSENEDTKKKTKANIINGVPVIDQGIEENIAEMKDGMDHTVVNIESERNLIDGTVRPLPGNIKLDDVSIESALECNTATKKRKRTECKKVKDMNDVQGSTQLEANARTFENLAAFENQIENHVEPADEHTRLDDVSTESALGNTETRKRRRRKSKKVRDMNEVQSSTKLEANARTLENLAAFESQIDNHVEPADKMRAWIGKETERSVARRKNELRKLDPSDAMYKILFSDEEPVDAMFKILLPYPPIRSEIPVKRKLIVLDVNGLLADVVMPAPKDCRGDVHILRRAIFKRPFVDDFLNFCFQNFDVAIWSSRSKVIIDRIVDYLLGSRKNKLLCCWNMSHATQTGSKTLDNIHKPLVCKDLRKIWENFEGYDESNTLLLDDSPYKALLNPLHTAIFPSSFHYGDKEDNSLGPGGDLRVYLEGLLSSNNVQSYVEQNPFGQAAINKTDPSWEFYSSVLQTVTSQSLSLA